MRQAALAALLLLAAGPARAADPRRIADLWFAHNAIMIMLGAAGRIVVTTDTERLDPWMFRVAPELGHALQLAAPVPSAETLIANHVDLVLASTGSPAAGIASRAGIPVATFSFHDAAGLVRDVDGTADAVGGATAHANAQRYDAYLAQVLARVRAKTTSLTEGQRPRVLHIQMLHPLRVDGRDTIIDDWIRIAGGANAAAAIAGTMKPVSAEQVAAWNPDVIIVDSEAGTFDPQADGGVWQSTTAVRTHRVVVNPRGVYTWDRYGAEYPLQILWAAKTLHPELFADVDMVAETQRFYREFYRYDLRPDDAARILAGEPPTR